MKNKYKPKEFVFLPTEICKHMNIKLRIPLNYGSTAGLIAFGLFLLFYFLGFNPIGNISWLSFWVPIPFIYKGIKEIRESEYEGFISYGQAFKQGVIISFIYASLFAMLIYIFGTFIDGSFIEEFIEQAAMDLEETKELMTGIISEAVYEQSLDQILDLTPAQHARSDFFNKFIFGIIVSLIAAYNLKKPKPIFDNIES